MEGVCANPALLEDTLKVLADEGPPSKSILRWLAFVDISGPGGLEASKQLLLEHGIDMDRPTPPGLIEMMGFDKMHKSCLGDWRELQNQTINDWDPPPDILDAASRGYDWDARWEAAFHPNTTDSGGDIPL